MLPLAIPEVLEIDPRPIPWMGGDKLHASHIMSASLQNRPGESVAMALEDLRIARLVAFKEAWQAEDVEVRSRQSRAGAFDNADQGTVRGIDARAVLRPLFEERVGILAGLGWGEESVFKQSEIFGE